MENQKTLYYVAYIFQIISTVLTSFSIIAMAWMIPMTLATKKAMNETSSQNHVALGICTLLFQNWISGILILVATTSKN